MRDLTFITLASFLHCHRDLELDSVGVSTKFILVVWPWLGGLYARYKYL